MTHAARRVNLALKLSLLILGAGFILRIIMMAITIRQTSDVILGLAQDKGSYAATATVSKIESVLKAVEVAPLNIAAILESKAISKEDLLLLIRTMVHSNYYVFGSTVAYEPKAFDPAQVYFAPYYHEVGEPGSELQFLSLAPPYDYFLWEWYSQPKQRLAPYWSEPYVDPGVHRLMSTYSVPFFKTVGGKAQFQGVVTADLTLDRLVDIVNNLKVYGSGHAFLLSRKGTFLSHPNPKLVLHESIFSVASTQLNTDLHTLGDRMIHGERGFVMVKQYLDYGKCWIFYAPIESGWSTAIVIPDTELLAESDRITRDYLYHSVVMFGLLFIAIVVIARRITAPLNALAGTTREIAKGNLDVEIPVVHTRDEVADLATSFENMRVSLKDYIKNLEATAAANSRFESELKIARNIQMSFLPHTFPPFPDREEFDLFAFLNPAMEVGGDLYDFFIAANGALYFLVGDVSDKGVPAALFMAATKTLMRGFAHQGANPDEVMSRVNRELCLYNESMMFVTVYCGSLNLKTGDLAYANAGHNPPILIRDGEGHYVHLTPGFVLGVDPAFVYQLQTTRLRRQDLLIVYSDGITEAMNAQKQMFSEEGLLEVAVKNSAGTCAQLVDAINKAVSRHVAGFQQSDDITVLAVRYHGDRSEVATNVS